MTEPIWKQAWRPTAALIYLVICLFDFVIMPMAFSNQYKPSELVSLALQFKDPLVQVKALEAMSTDQQWEPLTTKGNGIFHMSFGAILGAAAFGRSQEKKALIEKNPTRGKIDQDKIELA
jgi:hypothetical protein